MSWKNLKLRDIVTLNYGKSLPERVRVEGEVPVYGSGGITGTHNLPLVSGPGIIVGRKGTVGAVYWESRAFYPIDTVYYAEPAHDEVHKRYLYYLLNHLPLASMNSDAAVPGLNRDNAYALDVTLPDFATQRRIASILSAYDDLIENNRRRIVLLEQAARLLYREWFVYYRFPGHETVKIIDGLPEGWKKATLSSHVELVKDAVQPDSFRPDDVHIGLEHIPRRSFVLSNWESADGLESHKYRFKAYDIIFGKIRPYFHKVGFALCDGVASSDAFVWRVRDQNAWSLILCATSSDHFVSVASKTVREGSKMPRADWKVLAQYEIPRPPDGLLSEFDRCVRSIAEECRNFSLQNRALGRARDLLLPRLMDGRIPV